MFFSSEQSKVFNTFQGGIMITDDAGIAAGIQEYHEQTAYPGEMWIDKHLHNVILRYYLSSIFNVGAHYLSVAEHPCCQHTFGWQPEDYSVAMHMVGRPRVCHF